MKKLLFLALTLINMSWAIPSQQQIKDAMQQNNPQLVEQLSKEVLQVKPNSAKAHYFLGEAYLHEGRKQLALGEFNTARSIDNSLSFAGNPYKFNELVNEASNIGNKTTQTVTTTRVVKHHNNSALLNFLEWFFTIAVIILILILIFNLVLMFLESRRIDKEYKKRILAIDNQPPINPTYNYNNSQATQRQYTHNPGFNTGTSNSQPQATTNHYHSNNNATGGMGGNGFVNGMVAGVVLDELLSNRNHSSSHGGGGYSRDYDDSDTTTTTTTRSSSWDDSSSSSSSSSWDSGSDSSSSWDSGSSGSSDW